MGGKEERQGKRGDYIEVVNEFYTPLHRAKKVSGLTEIGQLNYPLSYCNEVKRTLSEVCQFYFL